MSKDNKLSKEEKRRIELKDVFEASESLIDNLDDEFLISDILSLKLKLENIKELLSTKRDKLLDIMISSKCNKIVDINSKKVISVSKASSSRQYKFDVDKFKEDHPELYEKYLVSNKSYSRGGNLTIRNMSNRDYEIYKSIADDLWS